jgi:TRAP-type C4-dicarboxylate transport system permease small subunit
MITYLCIQFSLVLISGTWKIWDKALKFHTVPKFGTFKKQIHQSEFFSMFQLIKQQLVHIPCGFQIILHIKKY